MAARQIIVGPTGAGRWKLTGSGIAVPSSTYATQAEAINVARQLLKNGGGGELVVQGEDGKIRDKDTIAPGHDPSSIPG